MSEMPTSGSASTKATAVGATAILMWSTLALLTTWTGRVPPFQLTAMAFTVASCIGLVYWLKVDGRLVTFRSLPLRIWALGIGGLFGYHLFYFIALRRAPAEQASLIAYLWPLLIVLFAATLPGERLRWFHLAGGLTGFVGAGVLITGGMATGFEWQFLPGYLAAFACALTWSTYSVLSRRWGEAPTVAVGAFCVATALLAWTIHLLTEATIWPVGRQWAAVAGLGIGPVGLAFFVWDWGVKRGNIKALGVLSYFAPLLSTVLLVVAGRAEATPRLAVACVLIIAGAAVAARAGRKSMSENG